jgi:CubicO group peptidase (beta-lactamase class C family)
MSERFIKNTMFLAASVLAALLAGCGPCASQRPTEDAPPPSTLEALRQIDAVAEDEIAKNNFPGAVIFIGQARHTLYFKAFGDESLQPTRDPMHPDTIFDIASLSKPVGTAPSILILADRGQLRLDDDIAGILPEFARTGGEPITIRHLLTHTSGLPAYMNAAELKARHGPVCPDNVLEKIASLKRLSEPGETFRYSCLGYIVLGKIVERVSGSPLDVFARDNLFAPLGMKDTAYRTPPASLDRIAPTVYKNGELLRGSVHDPLAALMGGVSGNAGIFSTAEDLARFARMLLSDGRGSGRQILSPNAVRLLTTEQSFGRACGFDVSSAYANVKGQVIGPAAFCHTGYTGTSLVADPDSKLFVIILTNRVHPEDKGSTKRIRTQVVDIAARSLPAAPGPLTHGRL